MPKETLNLNKIEKENYSEEVVQDIVKKLQEGGWRKVLNSKSIIGDAGSNRAAINAYIEKKTGKIIMFGNSQYLPKEVVSNPDYTSAVFLYNYGNFFLRIRDNSLEIDPAFFEKVGSQGASKQALENLKEALIRFDREYIKQQMSRKNKNG